MTVDSTSHPTFLLDSDPWIPVLYADGSLRDVSLRELFVDAHRIRDISPDMAQQKLPLLRLALAILYHLYAYPAGSEPDEVTREMTENWLAIWNEGCFSPDDINGYFDDFSNRFDLFDSERPFFQTPGLQYTEAAGRPYDPISEVIADVPKPKKYLMAMRARNTLGDISFAEAARWLVFMQAYDCAGIKTPVQGNTRVQKGKVYAPKDAVGTGWMGAIGGVFLKGETLFDTLMLNWVIFDLDGKAPSYFMGDENLPAWDCSSRGTTTDIWEAEVHGTKPGPAALYTWQSRRVRLVPNEEGTAVAGIVSCYGDIPPRPVDYQSLEPMTAWRVAPAQKKKLGLSYDPLMPARHIAGRSLWRGFAALLTLDESGVDRRPGVVRWIDYLNREYGGRAEKLDRPIPPLSICAQGITYGTQSSVIEESIADSFDVAVSLCNPKLGAVSEVESVIAQTENCVRSLVGFVRSVDEIAGNRHGDAGSDNVREQAYGELDELFRWRIAHMPQDEFAGYVDDWRGQTHMRMLDLGKRYLADSGVAQFTQRTSGQGPQNVSNAMRIYQAKLNEYLGRLLVGKHAGGTRETEGTEEGR